MENEAVSKNFIEQIIDKDLAEGHSTGAKWLFAYWTCQIYSFKLWTCTGI